MNAMITAGSHRLDALTCSGPNWNPLEWVSSSVEIEIASRYTGKAQMTSMMRDSTASTSFATNNGDETDSFLTWRAVLNYSLNATNYVYGVVATGGKSGGISGQPGMYG